MENEILEKLRTNFDENDIIEFVNLGVKGPTEEHIHHTLKIISDMFEGKTKVQRHQMVYSIIGDYLRSGELHALILKLKTHSENK